MQEKFVVRICGCHRSSPAFVNVIADSRVDAVRAGEVIGEIFNKYDVRAFLEGKNDGLVSISMLSAKEEWCPFFVNNRHYARIEPISDRLKS